MQMPVFSRLSTYAVTIGALLASAASALAATGQPSPWALGLQEAASPVMADITWFHNFLLVLITENQNRSRRERLCLHIPTHRYGCTGISTIGRPGTRVHVLVLILILFLLMPHLLLGEILLVHLVGQADLLLLLIVVRRTTVPPPVRVVIATVAPGGDEAAPATEAVAGVETAKAHAAVKAGPVKRMLTERGIGTEGSGC